MSTQALDIHADLPSAALHPRVQGASSGQVRVERLPVSRYSTPRVYGISGDFAFSALTGLS